MWRMNENGILTLRMTDVGGFKSLEKECTQKINEITDIGNCRNDLALIYNNRGHAKYMQVDFVSAVEDYNKALQLNPNLAVAYYNRATIYYRMGDFTGAFHDMEKALELDPSNVEFQAGYDECVKMNFKNTQ